MEKVATTFNSIKPFLNMVNMPTMIIGCSRALRNKKRNKKGNNAELPSPSKDESKAPPPLKHESWWELVNVGIIYIRRIICTLPLTIKEYGQWKRTSTLGPKIEVVVQSPFPFAFYYRSFINGGCDEDVWGNVQFSIRYIDGKCAYRCLPFKLFFFRVMLCFHPVISKAVKSSNSISINLSQFFPWGIPYFSWNNPNPFLS